MEDGAVEKRRLRFLAGARMFPFTAAFREVDEILYRNWSILLEESDHNRTFGCVERCINSGLPGHENPFVNRIAIVMRDETSGNRFLYCSRSVRLLPDGSCGLGNRSAKIPGRPKPSSVPHATVWCGHRRAGWM